MEHKTISKAVQQRAQKSHTQRIREVYETKDLGSIMGRFYEAMGGDA